MFTGITLSREDNGIWVYNRSNIPIFVNSLTLENNIASLPTRVPMEHCLCVFDPVKVIQRDYTCSIGNSKGPIDINSVTISFGKGWGEGYSRMEISSCPCWIEIMLAPCRWSTVIETIIVVKELTRSGIRCELIDDNCDRAITIIEFHHWNFYTTIAKANSSAKAELLIVEIRNNKNKCT